MSILPILLNKRTNYTPITKPGYFFFNTDITKHKEYYWKILNDIPSKLSTEARKNNWI